MSTTRSAHSAPLLKATNSINWHLKAGNEYPREALLFFLHYCSGVPAQSLVHKESCSTMLLLCLFIHVQASIKNCLDSTDLPVCCVA